MDLEVVETLVFSLLQISYFGNITMTVTWTFLGFSHQIMQPIFLANLIRGQVLWNFVGIFEGKMLVKWIGGDQG